MVAFVARIAFRRRRIVTALWGVLALLSFALSPVFIPAFRSNMAIPGSESHAGITLLNQKFPQRNLSGTAGQIVFIAKRGHSDPSTISEMTKLFEQIESHSKGQVHVLSPFDTHGDFQLAQDGPYAGALGVATVLIPPRWDRVQLRSFHKQVVVLTKRAEQRIPVNISLGGEAFANRGAGHSALPGLVAALLILLVAFRSAVITTLTIATASAGLLVANGVISLLSRRLHVAEDARLLAVMIGLSVGLGAPIFVLARYQASSRDGLNHDRATIRAMETAGRSMFFAAATTAIALLTTLLIPAPAIRGIAIVAAVAILCTMLATLTLLPALLGLSRAQPDRTRRRDVVGLLAAGATGASVVADSGLTAVVFATLGILTVGSGAIKQMFSVAHPVNHLLSRRRLRPFQQSIGYRSSQEIARRAWPTAILATIALLGFTVPLLGTRLARTEVRHALNAESSTHASRLITESFGVGRDAPLIVAAHSSSDDAGKIAKSFAATSRNIRNSQNVAFLSNPLLSSDGTTAQWLVALEINQGRASTSDFINELRTNIRDNSQRDLQTYVTGAPAVMADFGSLVSGRLRLVLGTAFAAVLLCLFFAVRCVLVPFKLALIAVLSTVATFGAEAGLLRWSWGARVLGINGANPTQPWIAVVLLPTLLGLSVCCQLLLVSQVQEEFAAHQDQQFVSIGLARGARGFTAAITTMAFVFASFAFDAHQPIRVFAIAFALATLINATFVRVLMLPAFLFVCERQNWWRPRWFNQSLANVRYT